MRAAPSIESAVTYIFNKPASDEDPDGQPIDNNNSSSSGSADDSDDHGSDERHVGKRLKTSHRNGASTAKESRRSAKKRIKSHLPEFKATAVPVRPTATTDSADDNRDGNASSDEPEVDIFAEWIAATSGKTTAAASTDASPENDGANSGDDDNDSDGNDSEDEFLAELILLRRSKVTKNT
mgnify:CR=1 FL=1